VVRPLTQSIANLSFNNLQKSIANLGYVGGFSALRAILIRRISCQSLNVCSELRVTDLLLSLDFFRQSFFCSSLTDLRSTYARPGSFCVVDTAG